jgi:hypothetical protein
LVLVQAVHRFSERRGQIQEHVVRVIDQTGVEIRIAAASAGEGRAAKAAISVQDCVLAGEVAARRKVGEHVPSQRGRTGYISDRRGRWIDLHEVKRTRLEGEVAGDRHRAGGVLLAGRKRPTGVDLRVADRADAAEQSASIHRGERRESDRAVYDQRARVDRCWAGVSVKARQRQGTSAFLGERAADAAAKNRYLAARPRKRSTGCCCPPRGSSRPGISCLPLQSNHRHAGCCERRQIDISANAIDEPCRGTGAGVEEDDSVVVGEGSVAGCAEVAKPNSAVIGEDSTPGRAVVEKTDSAVLEVEGGAAGCADVAKNYDAAKSIVHDGGAAAVDADAGTVKDD